MKRCPETYVKVANLEPSETGVSLFSDLLNVDVKVDKLSFIANLRLNVYAVVIFIL